MPWLDVELKPLPSGKNKIMTAALNLENGRQLNEELPFETCEPSRRR